MAVPRRPLITELDVRRAARRGERTLNAHGDSVTPSAFDAARQLNVELTGAGPASAGKKRPNVAPSVAAPVAKVEGKARVIVGADHGGVTMKDAILAALRAAGHEVEDVGTF